MKENHEILLHLFHSRQSLSTPQLSSSILLKSLAFLPPPPPPLTILVSIKLTAARSSSLSRRSPFPSVKRCKKQSTKFYLPNISNVAKIKNSLSIQEATLMKLKLGSQRDLSSSCEEEVVGMESDCSSSSFSGSCAHTMALEPNSTSTDVLKSSQHLITSPNEQDSMMMDTDSSSATVCPYAQDPNRHCNRNSSVLDLFFKYNNSRRQSASTDAESTAINNSSTCGFPSTVNCHSSISTKGGSEFECLSSSSSIYHM